MHTPQHGTKGAGTGCDWELDDTDSKYECNNEFATGFRGGDHCRVGWIGVPPDSEPLTDMRTNDFLSRGEGREVIREQLRDKTVP